MINERIKTYVEAKGIKFNKFAEITGIPQGSVSDIKNGKRDPGSKIIAKIILNTDINANWLFTGEGPMTRPRTEQQGGEQLKKQILASETDPELTTMIKNVKAVMASKNKFLKAALRANLIAFESALKDNEKMENLERDMQALKKIIHPVDPGTDTKEM